MQAAILFGLLHIPVHWLNSYPSTGSTIAGWARGDGPMTVGNLPQIGSFLQAHQAVTVATVLRIPPGTLYRSFVASAPTYIQLVNKIHTSNKALLAEINAFKQLNRDGNSPIVTQTGVASYKVAALRAAWDWMAKQPAIGPALAAVASSAAFITGEQAKQGYLAVEKNLPYFKPLTAALFH
jgi:hypothetical protein